MADVAAAVGVSPGTLYNYVESKDALFALALRWSLDRRLPDPPSEDGSLQSPGQWVLARIGPDDESLLGVALKRKRAPADQVVELRVIVGQIYDRLVRLWSVRSLLEGSVRESGELHEL